MSIERVLWIGYTTHDEAIAKGVYPPDEPWTYDLLINSGRPFSKVVYAVPFGKADFERRLSPQITYRERGPLFGRLPKLLRFLIELPAAISLLDKAAHSMDPQVIQVCGPNLPALLVWLVPRLWRVSMMCFIEAFWETLLKDQPYMSRSVQKMLPYWYRAVYRNCDGYCDTPPLDRASCERLGMDPSRIYPWVQPIDLPSLASLDPGHAPSEVLAAPRPRIVSVGKPHPEKHSLDALRIFVAMGQECIEGSLVLVRDGQLRADIERCAIEDGVLERVVVTGQLPLTDGHRVVKACDLYLATMQVSALLEAMAAGLPIVAYDNETHWKMIVHGQTGVLSPNRDIAAAAAALQELAMDDGEEARIGAAAKEYAQQRYAPAAVESIFADPLRRVAMGQLAAAAR